MVSRPRSLAQLCDWSDACLSEKSCSSVAGWRYRFASVLMQTTACASPIGRISTAYTVSGESGNHIRRTVLFPAVIQAAEEETLLAASTF